MVNATQQGGQHKAGHVVHESILWLFSGFSQSVVGQHIIWALDCSTVFGNRLNTVLQSGAHIMYCVLNQTPLTGTDISNSVIVSCTRQACSELQHIYLITAAYS